MFKKMWTLSLAKYVYIIGIVLLGIFSFILAENSIELGILVFIVGNIAWRLIIESIILLFSIHERLGEILKELRISNGKKEIDEKEEIK